MPKEPNQSINIAPAPGTIDDAAHTRSESFQICEESNQIKELEMSLRAVVRGEVRFDNGSRGLYSTDGSNYRQIPIGIVIPVDVDDVIATIRECHRYGAPVLPRAGGTSLAGQCTNVAVVIDFSKYMNNVVEILPGSKLGIVQPGCILDHFRQAAERYHLTFAPDPATHTHNCIGGMIGNNSCGVHSVMGGKTVDNIEELDILTYDGFRMTVGKTSDEEFERIISEGGRKADIYQKLRNLRDKYADLIRENFPNIPRRVSGYNLDQLLPENGFNVARALVGSEGTCVTVLEAKCNLVYSPPARSLLVLGYLDVFSAGDHVMEVLASGPTAIEGIDDRLVLDMEKKNLHPKNAALLPPGGGWLLVEYGGETREESDAKAHKLMARLEKIKNSPSMKLFDNRKEERMIWEIRESALGATANVPGEKLSWEGWEDSAVPPNKMGDYLRDLRKLLDKYDYACDFYGHFGQGCVHTRIDFDFITESGIETYRRFMDEATDLVLSYGGSLSGEHGDGQSRAEYLPKMFGEELMQAFREFKTIWDPDWEMNPGKVVNPYKVDQNLRLGTDYNPPQYKTYFKYPNDDGSFSRATLRCVGVGKCRRMDDGTMCPSFMATREEKDSTRGRARLLFEMLEGNPVNGEWSSEAVRDSLELCLACKGCKGECPVNVDMATYKAEFFSHYYENKARPLNMYAFGLIFKWARLAALAPGLANFFTHAPVIGGVVKKILNVSPEREIPQFAPESFQSWFRKRPIINAGKPKVMLWPDTFNNYFFPDTAKAAVEVLEKLGNQVVVPNQHLCCGRPLYDYGLLDQAIKQLEEILHALRPHIAEGTPIVCLEPSCVSVFRDELLGLFPLDENAHRLSEQAITLGEFVDRYAKDFKLPEMLRKALVHGHCHHKAVLNMDAEEGVFSKLKLDYEVLDSGCCGMAGAFGYTEDHYEVSLKCGERVLLPAVKNADKKTLIIADGFSCREQIQQTTNRRGMHTAEVLHMAMTDPAHILDYSEKRYTQPHEEALEQLQAQTNTSIARAVGAGALILGGILAWNLLRGRNKGD